MSIAVTPLTVYEMFRAPLRIIKSARLALKGVNVNKNCAYGIFNDTKNQTIFYVGLYDEEHLYLLSKKIGPTGKLVVFTTTKKSDDQLLRLKKIFGLKNIIVAPITFSIASNEVIFAAQPAIKEIVNSANLTDSRERKSYKKIEISYNETLDNYCNSNNIYPQLLEIKLPWHELAVLKGAKKMLINYKPKLIIECDVRFSSKSKVLEIFQFLTDLGYKGSFILDNVKIRLANFDFDIYQNPKSNFYCKEFVFE